MTRPKKKIFTLAQRLEKIKAAALTEPPATTEPIEWDEPLEERIRKILHLLRTAPVKAVHMTFLIMYDIENNKVRKEVAKYLLQKGCVRIQKSVFLISADHKLFEQIHKDLHEVQQYYENNDSIILVPFNTTDARSMKIIGKDVQVNTIVNKPNTLFF
jgi:CRISPR-associated endonuclease Cas2